MQSIEEVKKIEEQARQLERSYQEKLEEMEKDAEAKIAEMKRHIEQDIEQFEKEEEDARQEEMARLRERMAEETDQELAQLRLLHEQRRGSLADTVIQEVMRQYGNR